MPHQVFAAPDGVGVAVGDDKEVVGYGHSLELLLVDILSALQWFNPAIWMLRADWNP